jgi:hypothetical protein
LEKVLSLSQDLTSHEANKGENLENPDNDNKLKEGH